MRSLIRYLAKDVWPTGVVWSSASRRGHHSNHRASREDQENRGTVGSPYCKAESRWLLVEACPVCGNSGEARSANLHLDKYRHGDEVIPLPWRGVRLVQCGNCGLAFKDVVPSPGFLAEVFTRQAGKMWAGVYDFAEEARVVEDLIGDRPFDVLDIGASNGGLLAALQGEGRRSALDVVMHPGLERWLHGEFVRGLVDNENLVWSEKPYDVVTMFDVAEHLYRPNQTFVNLQRLVKPGGFVIAETGDLRSTWPQRFGTHRWWYACRFEHHVLWSEESFRNIAKRYGFRVVDFRRKRHKERSTVPMWRDLVDVAGIGLYLLTPDSYGNLTKLAGKYRPQPWSPFTRDHFRVVLRKD